MNTTEKQFLALLRLALHQQKDVPHVLLANSIDWEEIYKISKAQAVLGVVFPGVLCWNLQSEVRTLSNCISEDLLAKWYGMTEILSQRNAYLTDISRKVCAKFNAAGFRACILKGQANSIHYQHENDVEGTAVIRTPGDIDVWVMPDNVTSIAEGRKRIIEYIKGLYPDVSEAFLHIKFPIPVDVPVEVHYAPMMDASPWRNNRMRCFLEEHAGECFANETTGGFAVPVKILDGVFQLYHIRRHFIKEGIGMRHIIDYYFLLKSMSRDERTETMRLLRDFGCGKFTAALMYVVDVLAPLREGACADLLLCRPNERTGRFLLEQILRGGNFGQYDERLNGVDDMAFMQRVSRYVLLSLNRLRYFPSDVLWGYVLRLRLMLWRCTGSSSFAMY